MGCTKRGGPISVFYPFNLWAVYLVKTLGLFICFCCTLVVLKDFPGLYARRFGGANAFLYFLILGPLFSSAREACIVVSSTFR